MKAFLIQNGFNLARAGLNSGCSSLAFRPRLVGRSVLLVFFVSDFSTLSAPILFSTLMLQVQFSHPWLPWHNAFADYLALCELLTSLLSALSAAYNHHRI